MCLFSFFVDGDTSVLWCEVFLKLGFTTMELDVDSDTWIDVINTHPLPFAFTLWKWCWCPSADLSHSAQSLCCIFFACLLLTLSSLQLVSTKIMQGGTSIKWWLSVSVCIVFTCWWQTVLSCIIYMLFKKAVNNQKNKTDEVFIITLTFSVRPDKLYVLEIYSTQDQHVLPIIIHVHSKKINK